MKQMSADQKKIITDAIQSAFTVPVSGSRDVVKCLLSDEKIETLFGAMCLIVAFGSPPMAAEK